ncbi:sensor histidine kinase [Paraburkholderia acidisoli]|uniref:histidine kinase n=1 Tax=Paraburkholderia acidisoli TaxID=2571748 RepID=A0A7Z2GPE4_9BURK|nr:ATP-binding protein [Paraburkholderia acidisoli]QGZ65505.1 two-component sensor histidine kinase [Paraburkholderia acidisoli]
MKSIRRRLLGWLACGFAATIAIAGYGIFQSASHEAGELFDYELRAVAVSMPPDVATARSVESAQAGGPGYDGIDDDRILIQIWSDDRRLVYHSLQATTLQRFPPGFQTVNHAAEAWRVFGLQRAGFYIQVAQPMSIRASLARHLALKILWPIGLLVPIVVVLVLVVVRRGLSPIQALSDLLATRNLRSLDPLRLDESAPMELRPLIDALNDLLARLNAASQTQRTFIADAAHELRTPLAALKLQYQAALRDGSLSGDPQALERIAARLNRLIRLVHQLLTLARADAQTEAASASVSLRRIAEEAIGEFSLLAEEKRIDLGIESQAPVTATDACNVHGDAHALMTMVSNLLDNAIRYTPPGGKIDLVLTRHASEIGFEVVDTGPGIPAEDLGRVLDRFYRGNATSHGTGSGLGLSIVSTLATRHALALTLRNNAEQGLTVAVSGLKAAG